MTNETRSFANTEVLITFRFPEKVDTRTARRASFHAMQMIDDKLATFGVWFPTLSCRIDLDAETEGDIEGQATYPREEDQWIRDASFHTELSKAISHSLRAALYGTEYGDLKILVPVRVSNVRCVGVI